MAMENATRSTESRRRSIDVLESTPTPCKFVIHGPTASTYGMFAPPVADIIITLCIVLYSLMAEAVMDVFSVLLGVALLSSLPLPADRRVTGSFAMTFVLAVAYAEIIFIVFFIRFFGPVILVTFGPQCSTHQLDELFQADFGVWNSRSVGQALLLELIKAIGIALLSLTFRFVAGDEASEILAPGHAFLSMLVGKVIVALVLRAIWLRTGGTLPRVRPHDAETQESSGRCASKLQAMTAC
ncbi:hypothetical protein L226DRAFT_557236 [Lentinus tigrinus ALCF2SS1-7]|uniref:Uncharacterized protein n=1 Tax=Lentinus tigrinus ALCF2SS1-6 TaxID=1328759 RepID=A0A5C2SRC9_9APHY|nr:hypothetical protein L227DRAFT_597333 [Lentinus tigrinus ALCF2SS1-6]RPD79892.1 hypothetical protein L226DRAFT_557236 [Lentinus tigrinus ALCF2SS1-7]